MKVLMMIITIAWTANVLATNIEDLSLGQLRVGVDNCSSSNILIQTIQQSGINPLDNDNLNKRTVGDEVCYSRPSGDSHELCIKNPRVVTVNKRYADSGQQQENRPRFSEIRVKYPRVGQLGDNRSDQIYRFDNDGCFVDSASYEELNSSASHLRYEDCAAHYRHFASNCRIYASGEPSCGNGRMARDYSALNGIANAAKDLARCSHHFPNLIQRMTTPISNPPSAESKADGSQTR